MDDFKDLKLLSTQVKYYQVLSRLILSLVRPDQDGHDQKRNNLVQ